MDGWNRSVQLDLEKNDNMKFTHIVFGALGLVCLMLLLVVSCGSGEANPQPDVEPQLPKAERIVVFQMGTTIRTAYRFESEGHTYIMTSTGGIIHAEDCLEADLGFRARGDE